MFRVRWADPYPLDTLVRPVAIDWREPLIARGAAAPLARICLPFGASPGGDNCGAHMHNLETKSLRTEYDHARTLEVHSSVIHQPSIRHPSVIQQSSIRQLFSHECMTTSAR